MTADRRDEHRRKALRKLLQDDDTQVTVHGGELRWLLDEVGRLQQSNDRLRRQNRRLRLRRGDEPVEAEVDTEVDVDAPGDDV